MGIHIRKIVMDVLKPHEPDIAEMAKEIAKNIGIEGVNISVYEIDKSVENVKITIEGEFENYTRIGETIKRCGGTIHSIDEVIVGSKVVSERETLHDRQEMHPG